VAIPFWLVGGLLLGLAPIFAWTVGARTTGPGFARLQMATNEEGLGMNMTEKATSKKATSP
jgi:hypothetical protein